MFVEAFFQRFFRPFNLLREPVYFTGSCYPFVRECIEENSPLAEAVGRVRLGAGSPEAMFLLGGWKASCPTKQ